MKAFVRAGTKVTITIDSYDGHTYSLQRSGDLTAGFASLTAVAPQTGSTGTMLTFIDNAALTGQGFYRVVLNR